MQEGALAIQDWSQWPFSVYPRPTLTVPEIAQLQLTQMQIMHLMQIIAFPDHGKS